MRNSPVPWPLRPIQCGHEGRPLKPDHLQPRPQAHAERVQVEQIRTLYRTAAVALNIALVGALVLCGVLLYVEAQREFSAAQAAEWPNAREPCA